MLYACGGIDNDNEFLNSCEVYDINKNEWK